MPKYYCDYCDIYLTHDSPSVRKSHINGNKHKMAVKAYYYQLIAEESSDLINQRAKQYEQFQLASGMKMMGAPPVMNYYPPPQFTPNMYYPPMYPPMTGGQPIPPPTSNTNNNYTSNTNNNYTTQS